MRPYTTSRGRHLGVGRLLRRTDQLIFPPPRARSTFASVRNGSRKMQTAMDLVSGGDLSLSNIITHDQPFNSAETAYEKAFSDPLRKWSSTESA